LTKNQLKVITQKIAGNFRVNSRTLVLFANRKRWLRLSDHIVTLLSDSPSPVRPTTSTATENTFSGRGRDITYGWLHQHVRRPADEVRAIRSHQKMMRLLQLKMEFRFTVSVMFSAPMFVMAALWN